jgi:hypothetical protein
MKARFCDFINAHSSAADPISVEQETSGHGARVRFGAPRLSPSTNCRKEAGNYGTWSSIPCAILRPIPGHREPRELVIGFDRIY